MSVVDRRLQDIRFGLRLLAKSPGASAVIILTLALVLGINTAVFGVLNTALLKSLPVRDPNKLVLLTNPNASGVMAGTLQGERTLLTYAEFSQLKDRATTLSSVCASQLSLERWPIRVFGAASSEQVRGRLVSENYFSTVGVRPSIGRFFTAKGAYAVLSYDYWNRRFGADPAIVGTTVRIRNNAVVIAGVAGPDFRGETVGQDADVWLPLSMAPVVLSSGDWLRDMMGHTQDKLMWLHAFGRRKPGVSIAQVQAEVNVLFHAILEESYPRTMGAPERKEALNQYLSAKPLGSGVFRGRKEFAAQWSLLLALAGLVLFVACINVANLLLARAAARSREVAVRLSIGAGVGRLVGQFLTESLVLATLSSVAGLFVAVVASRLLLRLLSDADENFTLAGGFDFRVLGFSAVAAVLTGIIFGLAPAMRARYVRVSTQLKESGRGASGPRRRVTLSKTLVVMQVALSLLLSVGAGLFWRTLWNLESIELGYPKGNLVMFQINANKAGYQGSRQSVLYNELAARIQQVPGVRSVGNSDRGLFSGFSGAFPVEVEDFTSSAEQDRGSTGDTVSPGYFTTVGIPLLLGREFTAPDMSRPPRTCIINEAFAKRFFAGGNPIGKHVTTTVSDDAGNEISPRLEVVGVAKDVRDQSIRGVAEPKFYIPGHGPWFEIRTSGDPNWVISPIRSVIASVDDTLTIESEKTLEQALRAENGQSRLIAQLAAVFALVALGLAAVGIYGLLSYSVSLRTNEIGIRMALGADKARVIRTFLGETVWMVVVGILGGVAATAVGARIIASQLYGFQSNGPRWSVERYDQVANPLQLFGIGAMDPATVGAVATFLFGVALLAAYHPAVRASRVDPMRSLRHE